MTDDHLSSRAGLKIFCVWNIERGVFFQHWELWRNNNWSWTPNRNNRPIEDDQMKHQRKKKSTFYYYLSILYWSTNCARSLLHSHLVITIYSSFHILSFHTSVIFIVSIVTSDFLHYYVNRYILKQSVFISKLDCTRVSSFSPSPSDSQIYLSQITGFLSHHTWKMIDQRFYPVSQI